MDGISQWQGVRLVRPNIALMKSTQQSDVERGKPVDERKIRRLKIVFRTVSVCHIQHPLRSASSFSFLCVLKANWLAEASIDKNSSSCCKRVRSIEPVLC